MPKSIRRPSAISKSHGTGTQIGDASELQTINKFFGRQGRFPTGRGLGSIKSMIGHAMPAAGIASLIKTAAALSYKVLPPSLHCEEPRPELRDSAFFVVDQTRPWIHQSGTHPRRAGVNAFGFGGSNAHLVLEEVSDSYAESRSTPRPRPIVNRRKCETELIAFSGETPAAVIDRLEQLRNQIDDAPVFGSLAELANSLASEFDHAHPVKLACVCSDMAEFKNAIPRGKEIVGSGEECFSTSNWYFTTTGNVPRGKVACIFPGLGFPGLIGNYPDHLMELCLHFPEVRAEFDAIELRDQHPEDPVPTSVIFSPPRNISEEQQVLLRERIAPMKVIEGGPEAEIELHPTARNIAASGITVTNWVSWIVMEKLGVPAHMLCGQSQGEMAALCASGVMDITEIIPRFWAALSISPNYAGKGRLAFVHASEEQLAEHLAGLENVSVAIHVAPQALVIGGVDSDIATLMERLRECQILSQVLPYPPIHTPQLNYLRDELKEIVNENLTFGQQTIPVYSAITEEVFPQDAEGIRNTALANLDQPVRFWQTIERMYNEGARVFIQVGGGSLAANIKSVLEKPDIIGAAIDVDYRDPITQLNHFCATLMAGGIEFDFHRLFDHRDLPQIDWRNAKPASTASPHAMPLRLDWAAFNSDSSNDRRSAVNGKPQLNRTAAKATAVAPAIAQEPAANGDAQANGSAAIAASTNGAHEINGAAHKSTPSDERRMPFVGRVLEHDPGVRIVVEHDLDIDEDLYLRDHVFIHAEDVKPVDRCLPVMPLTMILESMAEVAACVAPGLGVIGFENVKRSAGVALEDVSSMPIQIQAECLPDPDDSGVVLVLTKVLAKDIVCTQGVVRLSNQYRQTLDLSFEPMSEPHPWPFKLEEIYREGHLFHGPAFQCITELVEFAENERRQRT